MSTSEQPHGITHRRLEIYVLDVSIPTFCGTYKVLHYGLYVLGDLLISHIFSTDHAVDEHLIAASQYNCTTFTLNHCVYWCLRRHRGWHFTPRTKNRTSNSAPGWHQ